MVALETAAEAAQVLAEIQRLWQELKAVEAQIRGLSRQYQAYEDAHPSEKRRMAKAGLRPWTS